MATDLERRAMVEVFNKKASPTMFLSGLAQTPERNISDTTKVVMDIKRHGEDIAIDVVRGTHGRGNIRKRFTTKEYIPPVYDEYAWMNENELLLNRMAGRTEYDPVLMADILDIITDDMVTLNDKIDRAKEKQASDALFGGTIPLVNGDTIDFKQKATHQTNSAALGNAVWSNAAGDPDDDLQQLCTLNRKDGLGTSTDTIFGETAWKLYKNNTKVQTKTNFRRADLITIRPPEMNADGANFQGQITVGEYNLNVWTYPQFYLVPTGFGLPNEGTKVPYVPTSKVWVGRIGARMDWLYAGIAKLVPADPRLESIGLGNVPMTFRGERHLYGAVDFFGENAKYGVKSAPVFVPTDIDSFSVITVA